MRGWWVAVAVACGCGDDLIDDQFTAEQWTRITAFSPIGAPPANTTNRYADDPAVARFGQQLFFDKRYAGALTVASDLGQVGDVHKVACATCHDPSGYFTDTRSDNARSMGTALTGRNAPSLVNLAYYGWYNWAGAHDQIWKQGANGAESRDNFNSSRLAFAHFVFDHYRAEYDALFPVPLDPALDPNAVDAARFPPTGRPKAATTDPDGAWEAMTPGDQLIVNTIMANCGKAYEAYERLLISDNAPFDRYVAGDYTALPLAAKRGLALFIGKAACSQCHADARFTDDKFHNTAVMQAREDFGRYADLPRALNNTFSGAGAFSDDPAAGAAKLDGHVLSEELRGQFRTKALRHVALTGPFFHDGSMATLEDVVRFYNAGGHTSGYPGVKDPLMVPLNLSETEILDLVAFLQSLTGEPVPDELTVDITNP